MRNGKIFLNTLTLGHHLKTYILIGLCCYVMLLSVTALTHDHSTHAHSEEHCTACFFISQHVGVELTPFALIFPFLFAATFPFYEAVFLPLRLPANTRSRAPPVFSNELSSVSVKSKFIRTYVIPHHI